MSQESEDFWHKCNEIANSDYSKGFKRLNNLFMPSEDVNLDDLMLHFVRTKSINHRRKQMINYQNNCHLSSEGGKSSVHL